jgi:hypothetical protein
VPFLGQMVETVLMLWTCGRFEGDLRLSTEVVRPKSDFDDCKTEERGHVVIVNLISEEFDLVFLFATLCRISKFLDCGE